MRCVVDSKDHTECFHSQSLWTESACVKGMVWDTSQETWPNPVPAAGLSSEGQLGFSCQWDPLSPLWGGHPGWNTRGALQEQIKILLHFTALSELLALFNRAYSCQRLLEWAGMWNFYTCVLTDDSDEVVNNQNVMSMWADMVVWVVSQDCCQVWDWTFPKGVLSFKTCVPLTCSHHTIVCTARKCCSY